MTITQIECFVETAHAGNVSRAAESLFITQQAVSNHIKNLEKEMGFPLFVRKSKGVVLTKEGEILFEEWEDILSRLRISIDKAKDYHSGRSDHIRIGLEDMGKCSEDIMSGFLEYENSYPELKIDYSLMTPLEMIQQFDAGLLEIAILYQSEFDYQTQLKCMPLHKKKFKICIFLSNKPPLANRENLTLEDLDTETLGILDPKYSLDYEKKQNLFFSHYGLKLPQKKKLFSSRRALEMALIAGQCIAVVYEPMFLEEAKLLKKELDMPTLSTRIALYWKEDYMDTKARTLAGFLKEKLKQFN